MGVASQEAWKIIEEKRKYWYKTLSQDSIWHMFNVSFNIFDWLSIISDLTIFDTLWSSLISTLLLGLSFDDILTWNLLWEIELPDVEEFIKGVLIKLSKLKISELVPKLIPEYEEELEEFFKNSFENLETIIEEEYAEALKTKPYLKGIYGYSKYEEAFYDPRAVYDFLRSTLYAFTKKRGDIRTVKDKLEATVKALDIHPELVRVLFNRLSAISSIKEEAFTWDYGWWDRTNWAEEEKEGKLPFINYDLHVVEVPYEDIIDVQAGGYWDNDSWNLFCWTEGPPRTVHPYKREGVSVAEIMDKVWLNFRSRITATPLAVANYQTIRERTKWTESERLETYALPMSQRMHLERLTESIVRLKEPCIDALKLRLYKTAVLQLFGDLTRMHRWGSEMFTSMTEDELKNWWLERWTRAGLSRETLEELYGRIRGTISTYTSRRHKERLRFLRKRLLRV